MSAPPDFIQRYKYERALVSVRRKRVDNRWIQGFVLDVSDKLVLLHYVYNFQPDGLMVLRLKDISEWKVSDTNVFQKRLMDEEGVLSRVDFDLRAPISSFAEFLGSIKPPELVVVETETTSPNDILLGTVESVDAKTVRINHVTGIARLIEPPAKMTLRDITCCQTRSNYIGYYQRYFEREKR